MLLLAIENAGEAGAVALLDDARPAGDAVLGQLASEPGRTAADRLVALADRLLAAAGLRYADLDLIAVNRGPGSFTGIRCAVALGRGLALAADRPVLGITSFEALALAAGGGPLVTALDARRGEVYVQPFAAGLQPAAAPAALAPAEAARRLGARPPRVVGSGAALIGAHLAGRAAALEPELRPDAAAIARCAAARLAEGVRPQAGPELLPLYLRPPDARPAAPVFGITPSVGDR